MYSTLKGKANSPRSAIRIRTKPVSSPNSMKSVSPKISVLKRISNRKSDSYFNVMPEHAVSVIKHLVVNSVSSPVSYGKNQPRSTSKQSFSEVVLNSISQVRTQLSTSQAKLSLEKLQESKYRGKLAKCNKELLGARTKLEFLRFELLTNRQATDEPVKRIEEYKQVCTDLYEINRNKAHEISLECCLRGRLLSSIASLSSLSSNLNMHNQIVGDCLSGLFTSISAFCTSKIHSSLLLHVEPFSSNSAALLSLHDPKLRAFKIFNEMNYNQLEKHNHLMEQRRESRLQIKQIKLASQEKVNFLAKKLQFIADEIAKRSGFLEILKSKYDNINTLYARTQKNVNKNAGGQAEEHMCGQCNMVFVTSKNHKVACVVHQGEWSGSVWWCCGNTKRDATGCTSSKHVPLDRRGNKQNNRIVCGSCREKGHLSSLCPKDPNVRSKANQDEEISRLLYLKQRKEKRRGFRAYLRRCNEDNCS